MLLNLSVFVLNIGTEEISNPQNSFGNSRIKEVLIGAKERFLVAYVSNHIQIQPLNETMSEVVNDERR